MQNAKKPFTASLKEQGLLSVIKRELTDFLKASLPLEKEEILSLLEQPRRPGHGHLSLPLFSLSKKNKSSPQEEAKKISEQINKNLPSILEKCESLAGSMKVIFKNI